MARPPKGPDLKNIAKHRKQLGLNQIDYWTRFGVTQSGGSRYESGRSVPASVGALIWLLDTGKISDKDLTAAIKAARK